MHDTKDVIVIGAGFTGLTAAVQLIKKNYNILLLEADDHVGGRSYSKKILDGIDIELGGQYISTEHKRILKLIKEFNLKTFESYSKGDNFLILNGKVDYYKSTVSDCLVDKFKASNEVKKEIENGLKKLSDLCDGFSNINLLTLQDPPLPSHRIPNPFVKHSDGMAKRLWGPQCFGLKAEDWGFFDSMTFKTWIDLNICSDIGKLFFKVMTNQGFSCEPEEISLLQILWFFKTSHGLPGWAIGKSQPLRIIGGTHLIAQNLATNLRDSIKLTQKVIKIEQKNKINIVYTKNKIYKAKNIILAIPPQLINSIEFAPILPPDLFRTFSAFQTGNAMKVQAIYKKPFWRDSGFSGNGVNFDGPNSFTFDNSEFNGKYGILLGFITANQATIWNNKRANIRKKAVLDNWSKAFGTEALKPLEYIEFDWLAQANIRGGHGCHFTPGNWWILGKNLAIEHMPRFNNIIFAASDLAKDYNGYLEGAVYAGEQAAKEIVGPIDSSIDAS